MRNPEANEVSGAQLDVTPPDLPVFDQKEQELMDLKVKKQGENLNTYSYRKDFPVVGEYQKPIKGKRILKINEDSIMCPRVCCPANCRPFQAFVTSSSAVFELGIFERSRFTCTLATLNRPEIIIYKTERHYTEEDREEDSGAGFMNLEEDQENKVVVGKIVNPCMGIGSSWHKVVVFETLEGVLRPKYEVVKEYCCTARCLLPVKCPGQQDKYLI
jgi:hypothetical protein